MSSGSGGTEGTDQSFGLLPPAAALERLCLVPCTANRNESTIVHMLWWYLLS